MIIKKFIEFFNPSKELNLLRSEQENYIELEEDKKIFSNIGIDLFLIDLKNKCKIDNHEIDRTKLKEIISNKKDIKGCDNIVFRNCTINKLEIKSIYLQSVIFEDCNITILEIKNNTGSRKYDKIYNPIIINGGKITTFTIDNNEIDTKFYINSQYKDYDKPINITNLKITNTKFNNNFKLHHAIIDTIEIEDVDFEKNADFFKSELKKGVLKENIKEKVNNEDIGFKAINFRGLALFGDTIFKKKLIFKYVTIEGFSHFRKAQFKKGLDLDYVNIQNEMNFFDAESLDSKESKQNTSQETYRIIKHNFEKLGNKIEANRYYALELDQKRRKLETEEPRKWKDWIVFKLHDLSSEHSTDWLLALVWILFIASLTTLLHNSFWFIILPPVIYFLSTKCNDLILFKIIVQIISFSTVVAIHPDIELDNIFKFMSILTKEDGFSSNYFLMTLNKVSLGYLYYQFLMSVRKDTRK